MRAACDELLTIAEKRMRAEIRAIPNGVYYFEDVIEDDGITDRSYPMRLAPDGPRRRHHRRLHRLRSAGDRAGERDLCGHRLGGLQRVSAPDRSNHPAQ